MRFHVDGFFPSGFSPAEPAFLQCIQGSSRGLRPQVSRMSSSETDLAEPFGSSGGTTRRTRESVDDGHLASDGCGLSRLAEDFLSLLINDNESARSPRKDCGRRQNSGSVQDASCQPFVICYGFDARHRGNHCFSNALRMASRLHFLSRLCRLLVKRVANWILNEHSNGFTKFPDAAIDGSDLCQHHPHTFHGWSPGRQFGASRNSHGFGAGGLLSLAAVPSF